MARWFTSDAHFGHANIIRYTGRPYPGVAAMNDDLVARWNARVAPGDEVWCLGDLALGHLVDSLGSVAELQGRIVLVPGNHDRVARYQKRAAEFVELYRKAGIDDLVDGPATLEVGGHPVLVDHFPYRGDSQDTDRFVGLRPVDAGGWLLHGHVHERWRQSGRMINVGVDAWGGAPVAEATLAALIEEGPAERAPLVWSPAG